MRALELFSGIGGFAAAVAGRHEVVAAVDHDLRAQRVYAASWPHRREVKNLASVTGAWLAAFEADLWWMSPPCAPHGIRGRQEDLDDPRAAAFARLVGLLGEVGPTHLALENVPGFHGSRAWALLEGALERAGYVAFEHVVLCPTELGWPARRRRLYAVASRRPLVRREPAAHPRRRLPELIGPWRDELALPGDVRARFLDALHVVDADDPDGVAATFTRAYGRSPVYAGSYLRQRVGGEARLRRFAPDEIAALHGFPPSLSFDGLPPAHAWKLVGNSLPVPAVAHVMSWIPDASDPVVG